MFVIVVAVKYGDKSNDTLLPLLVKGLLNVKFCSFSDNNVFIEVVFVYSDNAIFLSDILSNADKSNDILLPLLVKGLLKVRFCSFVNNIEFSAEVLVYDYNMLVIELLLIYFCIDNIFEDIL